MKERTERLVHLTTRLAVLVQGCSNHGCAFAEEGGLKTNAICQCKKRAKEFVKAIDDELDKE